MKPRSDYYFLAGRILIAAIFLMSGLNKIMQPAATRAYMAQYGIPMTGLILVLAIMVETAGALSVLFGAYTRIGGGLLFLYMIPATLIFHTNFSDPNQMIHFMKNLAMTGGILYVIEAGPGRISVDARMRPEEATDRDVGKPRRRAAA